MSILVYALSTAPLVLLVALAARRGPLVEASGPEVAVRGRLDDAPPAAHSDAA